MEVSYIAKVGDSSSTTINKARLPKFTEQGYIEMVEENLEPTMIAKEDGTWELSQPLLFLHFTDTTDKYIQDKINEYNTANGVLFSDINSFPKYAINASSEHNAIALSFIEWVDVIWFKVRSITVIPTDEEFVALLDEVVFNG